MAANYQTPDLASVLRTLAAYAPPPTSQPAPEPPHGGSADNARGQAEESYDDAYEPSETTHDFIPEQKQQLPSQIPTLRRVPERHELPPPSTTDSTTITDWPTALRHVMKTVARSEVVMARVKKMINVQHEHERQWWDGREALLRKQEGRVEGRKKLNDVL